MKKFNTNKIWCLLLLFIVFALMPEVVSSQGTSPSPAERHEAEKAWEALIRAKGGREKLHSITNMLAEYFGMTKLYLFPNSIWDFETLSDAKKTPLLDVIDGTQSIMYVCNQYGIYDKIPDRYSDKRVIDQLALVLETKWNKPEPRRVTREKNGKKQLDVIETIISKERVDFLYEPEELLVSEVRFYYGGTLWRKYRLSDYTEINGMKFPQKIAASWELSKFKEPDSPSDLKIMLNVDYDPEIFAHPGPATTADAWKRKP